MRLHDVSSLQKTYVVSSHTPLDLRQIILRSSRRIHIWYVRTETVVHTQLDAKSIFVLFNTVQRRTTVLLISSKVNTSMDKQHTSGKIDVLNRSVSGRDFISDAKPLFLSRQCTRAESSDFTFEPQCCSLRSFSRARSSSSSSVPSKYQNWCFFQILCSLTHALKL